MKLHDALSGLLLLLLGVAVIAVAQTFPPVPGQAFGAALFPTLAGGGLVLFSLGLIVPALRAQSRGPWIELEDWTRRPRMILNAALVVGGLVFYALAVNSLGFFLTSFILLVALFLAFGVARRWIAPLALAVTFAIHYGFYTVLRVPLPWGVFEGIAW
jgi:putative tricarboxylic transport membrane protein